MYMAHERRQYILRLLGQRGSVRSADLAKELGVTDETIRTDLVSMQAKGLLRRVRGGAEFLLPAAPTDNSPRLDMQLAKLAATHVAEGMRLIADPSPLICALAAQLCDKPCAFITHSLSLIQALAPLSAAPRVISPGGALDKLNGLFQVTEETFRQLRPLAPGLAVLTPAAIGPGRLFYRNEAHAAWAKLAIRLAPCKLVLAPSAAFAAPATPYSIEAQADILITEDNFPPGFEAPCTETVPYLDPSPLLGRDAFDY